jgi:3-aminobutyryl-CoA ammonia-lyase
MSETCIHRLRLGNHDTHYSGGLIPAATQLRLFADCASELGARTDGLDGHLAEVKELKFFQPLFAGDFIEVRAELQHKGNRSRITALSLYRTVRSEELPHGMSRAVVLDPPELIATGTIVGVLPAEAAAS